MSFSVVGDRGRMDPTTSGLGFCQITMAPPTLALQLGGLE